MLASEHDESTYRVQYRSFVTAVIFLIFPPLVLYQLGGSLLDGSIGTGELVGLLIALVLLPLAAFYTIEFSSFTFSTDEDVFRWRRRGVFRTASGAVPLGRVVNVQRESLQSSNSIGLQYTYRLVVILDDDTRIPLTRGYSGLYDRKLDQVVTQIREHLGHNTPAR